MWLCAFFFFLVGSFAFWLWNRDGWVRKSCVGSLWCHRKNIHGCLEKYQWVIQMLAFWYMTCLCGSWEGVEKATAHSLNLSTWIIPWPALLVLIWLPTGRFHIIFFCQWFLSFQAPNMSRTTRLAYFSPLSSWRAAYKNMICLRAGWGNQVFFHLRSWKAEFIEEMSKALLLK